MKLVVSCANEPLKGWNDNLNGPQGIVAGSAMGVIRTVHADIDKNADFVPVDMVVHSMIAASWDVARRE
jgi:alcohol-forming fatty acyl-CoA reductase